MKVEIFPEDVLLDFTSQLLQGETRPAIRGFSHLSKFPKDLEFSEDFLPQWQEIVEPAVTRFIATTLGIRPFLFDVNGYTKRFTAAEPAFWSDIELKFTHRGALRIYEFMLSLTDNQSDPLYQLATPADALLISICTGNFSQYSFAWLQKNLADWLIMAMFVVWAPARMPELSWRRLLLTPETVELPLRDYLIEKAADYLAECSYYTKRTTRPGCERHERLYSAEKVGGVELQVCEHIKIIDRWIDYTNCIIQDIRKAVSTWTTTAVVNIDDERFIAGAAKTYGFDHEVEEFQRQATDYREGVGMEEIIYESILSDQTSN